LAYKAEHAVDLKSDLIVAAAIHPADSADSDHLQETVVAAQVHLIRAAGADQHTPMPMFDDAGADASRGEPDGTAGASRAEPDGTAGASRAYTAVVEVTADKGYHKTETLAVLEDWGIRTYIPEKKSKHRRRWTGKPAAWKHAYRANRRRARSQRGRRLQRLRSEYGERSFAHTCETGGLRRATLRGRDNVYKRYLVGAMGHNLSVIMRRLFGVGTPRSLQGASAARLAALLCALCGSLCALWAVLGAWGAIAALARRLKRKSAPKSMSAVRSPEALRRAAGRFSAFARRRFRAA
jgi:hypothetical protein